MSIFAEHALPEVPLDELVQLRVGIGIYLETLKRVQRGPIEEQALPIVERMHGEILAEFHKRMTGLARPNGERPGAAGQGGEW